MSQATAGGDMQVSTVIGSKLLHRLILCFGQQTSQASTVSDWRGHMIATEHNIMSHKYISVCHIHPPKSQKDSFLTRYIAFQEA